MNDNITGQTGTATPAAEDAKTFTQEDVNRIIQERLSKERSKGDAAFAQREQELAKRELMLTAREKLGSMGLSLELIDALNISSAEALDKSLAIIEKVLKGQTSARETPARISTGGSHGYNNSPAETSSIRTAMGLK
jgi:vacuolar-type H+-ATPase subunit I/STV1